MKEGHGEVAPVGRRPTGPDDRDRSERLLWGAVLLSILLHVVALWIVPKLWPAAAEDRPEPEDIEIRFELPEEPEPEVASEILTAEPVEEDPEVTANPAPAAEGAEVPDVVPVPVPVPAPEPAPQEVAPEPLEDATADDAAEGSDERRGVEDLPGRDPALATGGSRPAPRRSIDSAIRDFLERQPPLEVPEVRERDAGNPEGLPLPEVERLPASGFGLDRNLFFESTDYDWNDYARQVYMAIWRAWHNRLWASAEVFDRWAFRERTSYLDHTVLVRFTILDNGEVVDIGVSDASGCFPLDDSATDALSEVVLPPLPADFPRERENVRARFIATGEIRLIRRRLDAMKRAGWF